MQKYKEVNWWWYGILLLLAFFAGLYFRSNPDHKANRDRTELTFCTGLIVIFKGDTTLSWYGYIVVCVLFPVCTHEF